MRWIKGVLIGFGLVLALFAVIVVLLPAEPKTQAHTTALTGGTHTVTVRAQYLKDLEQTSGSDGLTLVVDGRTHRIEVNADELSVNNQTHTLGPGQDAEVLIDETGAVEVKLLKAGASSSGDAQ
jgi:hypothetical protein